MENEKIDVFRQMQPAVLAFVGDAVFNLFIRERLVKKTRASSHRLHIDAIRYVKASSQSMIAKELSAGFSEEEAIIFRRGRNAKSTTVPKNADIRDYHYATALEAVMGFLYLTGQTDRLNLMMERAASIIENNGTEKNDEQE